MSTEQNKALVRRFYAAFEANDQAALKEILAPDLAAYSQSAASAENREAHLQRIAGWNIAFSGTRFAIEQQIAEGDTVVSRVILRATHSGDFQGLAPTGKHIAFTGVAIERIKNGKIVERRHISDMLGMMQQLGLTVAPKK